MDTTAGVAFVPQVLPTERVILRDVRREGGALRAELARVVEASVERVEPPCPYAMTCGGCPWMIATLPLQHEWKRNFVAKAVGVPPEAIELLTSDQPLHYRRRARLAWKASRARVDLGYRKARTRDVIDVQACTVLVPVLDQALAAIRNAFHLCLRGEGEIALALGQGGKAVLLLTSDTPQPPEAYEHARALAASDLFAGVALTAGGATSPALFGDPREVGTGIDGKALLGTIGGFSQAHGAINDALVRKVIELAAPKDLSVLELYAGHGNLTVALAADAKHVHAVEQDEAAVRACEENIRSRGLHNVRVAHGDAADHVRGPHVDVIVLDPPRAGAKDVLQAIAARKPSRIVYVSCDTATLARDIKELASLGYIPDAFTAFDMFPQTSHVETVVRLAAQRVG